MITSDLGLGPMSPEIIEAVFRDSERNSRQLMLIASKNQIDYNGGYVDNWTTAQYMGFIRQMKRKYPTSNILVCRDHCGPSFNGIRDLGDTHRTIEADITSGFDLMHIDFCHFEGSKEKKLRESKRAVEHCLSLNPRISLEIGTDDNQGTSYDANHLGPLEKEVDFFRGFCKPEFYVVQTGSLIREVNQVGGFNRSFIEQASALLKSKGMKLKEHNADYLPKEQIHLRRGLVDALNIAPQLGVIQTSLIINRCLMYGISFDDFFREVYEGKRWKKWMHTNSPENKFLCALIAGHYHFASDKYKGLVRQLEGREDIHEAIINQIQEVIKHYEQD